MLEFTIRDAFNIEETKMVIKAKTSKKAINTFIKNKFRKLTYGLDNKGKVAATLIGEVNTGGRIQRVVYKFRLRNNGYDLRKVLTSHDNLEGKTDEIKH